jgi:hypothetical protein
MKLARSIGLCFFVIAIVIQAPTIASANPGLSVQPIDGTTVTPTNLVSTLVGPGVSFSNVAYTGDNAASGTFSGGTGIIGFNSGILLTSGSAADVVGPNNSDGKTTDYGGPGDADLEAIQGVGSGNSHDAAVLQFDFTPNATPIYFNFVFASEEYNEYANTQYNDVFAFFVNGSNCAKVPNTSQPVSVNNVNGGNPLGTNPQNQQYFINNDTSDPPNANLDTQMDGLTTVLTCRANVNAGQSNHIKLAIADTGDGILDSAVFLQANSFSTIPPTGVISGKVVNDANGNAVDDSEAGLAGAVVKLYADNTDGGTPGVFDGSDPQVGGNFTTGADGTWAFVNLDPGTYWTVETDPSGYVSTNAIAGTYATKETVDRIKIVLPASSSSTGNKFLDVHTTNNTQDFAAGFYDGVNPLTIQTVFGQGDSMRSEIDVPSPSGTDPYQAGPVTDQERSAKNPEYIHFCGNAQCDAQVDVSSLPSGSQPDAPIKVILFFKDNALTGDAVYAQGDAVGATPQLLATCDTVNGVKVARVNGTPAKCVASITTSKGKDKVKTVVVLVSSGNDPTIGKH